MRTNLVIAAAAVAVLGGLYYLVSPQPGSPGGSGFAPGETMVAVTMPQLSEQQRLGQAVFKAKCSGCHGENAGGIQGSGPPLIHAYYKADHHGDMAFVLAAERGVKSHHWRFGDMPPVSGVTRADILSVVSFVRHVQAANGV